MVIITTTFLVVVPTLVEGGLNLGSGKNGGNYISGSDMPFNKVDLLDQYCRNISGWAVTQRSRFDYSTNDK